MASHDAHAQKDIAFHAQTAALYDYVTNQPRAWSNELLFRPIDLRVRPGRLHLDLGCGTGQMLERYAGRFSAAIGVDHSPDMLKQARAKFAQEPALQFQQAGMEEFLERNAGLAADLVTCVGVLHHLRPGEITDMLRKVGLLLAPGGQLVIAEPVEAPPPPAWVARWNANSLAAQRVNETNFLQFEEPDEAPLVEADLLSAVEAAGFRLTRKNKGMEMFQHHYPAPWLERQRIRLAQTLYGASGNIVAILAEPSAIA